MVLPLFHGQACRLKFIANRSWLKGTPASAAL